MRTGFLLRLPKNIVDGLRCIQLFVQNLRRALVCQCQLIAQIQKSIVDGRRRKHQHFRFDAFSNDFVQQSEVAIFALIVTDVISAVSEVVRLVDDNEIVVAPIDPREVDAV